MKLPEIIKNIQQTLDVPHINSGGCVHFAYFLSQKLTKFGYAHQIVVINHTWENDPIESLPFDGCSHMVVFIPKIGYIDAEETYQKISDMPYRSVQSGILPKNYKLNPVRHNKRIWNNWYNRKYNRLIQKTITACFKKLTYE